MGRIAALDGFTSTHVFRFLCSIQRMRLRGLKTCRRGTVPSPCPAVFWPLPFSLTARARLSWLRLVKTPEHATIPSLANNYNFSQFVS